MIDSAQIDIDGGYGDDGSKGKRFLVLTGNFEDAIDAYKYDPSFPPLIIEIGLEALHELHKSIGEIF